MLDIGKSIRLFPDIVSFWCILYKYYSSYNRASNADTQTVYFEMIAKTPICPQWRTNNNHIFCSYFGPWLTRLWICLFTLIKCYVCDCGICVWVAGSSSLSLSPSLYYSHNNNNRHRKIVIVSYLIYDKNRQTHTYIYFIFRRFSRQVIIIIPLSLVNINSVSVMWCEQINIYFYFEKKK